MCENALNGFFYLRRALFCLLLNKINTNIILNNLCKKALRHVNANDILKYLK